MSYKFIRLTSVCTLLFCSTAGAYGQDNRFNFNDPLDNRNAAHASLYLKIPFSGGLKNYKNNKVKFGATLGFRRNYNNDYRTNYNTFNNRRQISVNVLDLKFNEHGFKTVSLVGLDFNDLKHGDIIMLKDKDGKSKAGKVVLYTLAAVGGALVILVAATAIHLETCSDGFLCKN